MRKKDIIRRTVWRLRCRKCGKKATYYGESLERTQSWDGWFLYKTELCIKCTPKEKVRQCDYRYEWSVNSGNSDALCFKDKKKSNTKICSKCVYNKHKTPIKEIYNLYGLIV